MIPTNVTNEIRKTELQYLSLLNWDLNVLNQYHFVKIIVEHGFLFENDNMIISDHINNNYASANIEDQSSHL
jgi:hypothetical protein